MLKKLTYISLDVEATGPVPGLFSMISLGAAAFNREGELLDKLQINLEELPWSKQDPSTMEFWKKNPIAYLRTKENPVTAEAGMRLFHDWYEKMEHPVFVFMPQKFDGLFVYWYLQTFVEGLGFMNTPDAIDVKTLAMATLGLEDPQMASKKYWPKAWKDKKVRHSHVAWEDAVEQGNQFIKILNQLSEERLRVRDLTT